MAIISNQNNTTPMSHTSFADKKDVRVIRGEVFPPLDDVCECIIGRCGYTNVVFGDIIDDKAYKNDFTSFIFNINGVTTNLQESFFLVKSDGSEIEIDTTLTSILYESERILDANGELVGFRVFWRNILQTEGIGKYYFKFNIDGVVGTEEVSSIDYQLYSFTEQLAKETVKLTWFQKGSIENGLDFTGLNVSSSLRFSGKVKYLADSLESDEYENTRRERVQIQTKIKKNYELVTYLIPKDLGDIITNDTALANSIELTTYNRNTYAQLVNQKVKFTEISDFRGNYNDNNTGSFTIQLENATQDTVKRNVRI